MIRILDICSGIGGFSLGLESTGGFDTVAFCEFDDFCRKVLNKHWPDVPIYKDLKEIGNEPERIIQDFDLICGGIPCQPFSVAGKKKGKEDDRHLWPYMYEIIKHKKPTWVIVENVGGFVNVALDDVCLDLETQGYATQSFIIPACSVEAPHRRDRIWILGKFMGDTSSDGRIEGESSEEEGGAIRRSEEGRMLESEGASDMENPGRSLRQGSVKREAHEDEVGKGNADQLERSGSTSGSHVADTEFKGLQGGERNSKGEGRKVLSPERHNRDEVRSETGRISGVSGETEDVPNTEQLAEHNLTDSGSDTEIKREGQETRTAHGSSSGSDVPNTSSEGSQGRGREHGLSEASGQEQASRRGDGSGDGKQHVADAKRNEHIGEIGGSSREEGEDAQRERQEDSTSGLTSGASEVRLSDNGHATGKDVADTERLGQQGQGELERPSHPEENSAGQASELVDGSQGRTEEGHTEPGVGGMADGLSTRLDGHYGFEREPSIPRVAHGIPDRVHRLKALGNAIVPQIIRNIGLAILEDEKKTNV